jgi:serine/threonine protein kinase/tetratricopeptide (TPR) repeat protein
MSLPPPDPADRHLRETAVPLDAASPTHLPADADLQAARHVDAVHARIGPYRLLSVLGEGGFGTVYLAEQASPRRLVAVKVLRAGLAGPQALSRFAHEAETLGRLHHPCIAQVFEAGFFDPRTGQTVAGDSVRPAAARGCLPFFAMEHVDGVPLSEYLRRSGIGRDARLVLLIKICDAVQHAHAKGVIHRDLKPANILVEAVGRPKVLDFGVARVTAEGADRTVQTDAGQMLGTIGYMSPEQIAADPAEIDTRTDVYALGVILYEMLCGRTPHRLEGRALHEASRIICQDPPARPSSFDRTLRGDLDTIVAKALEKDKSRRYQTAADLAADVQRFLRHEPITARPPTNWYHVRMFARRHRALVAGVAASFLLLVAGVVATSYLAVIARQQRDRARREADKALAVTSFLEDTLAAADPDKRGRDVRLADMLDAAAAEIDSGLADKPEVAAALHLAIGRAYRGLAMTDPAEREATRAISLLSAAVPPDDQQLLDARVLAAKIREDRSLLKDAETELRAVHAAMVRRAGGAETEASIGVFRDLTYLVANSGRLEEAERMARGAAAAMRRLNGDDDPSTMSTLLQLADVLIAAEKTDEAEPLLSRVLAYRERTLPPGDRRIQNVREMLGGLYRQSGRYDLAAQVHRATVAAFEQRYGPDHPRTLSARNDLGKALQQGGRLEEAAAILQPNLAALRRVAGEDHFDTLTCAAFLADVLYAGNRLEEAEDVRRMVAESRARILGPDHPQTLAGWTNLALILIEQGKTAQADQVLADLLARRQRLLGPEHNDVGLTLGLMGLSALRREDGPAAEQHYRRSLAIREKLLPEGHGVRGITMTGLGHALTLQGRFAEAEPLVTTGAEWVLADPRAPAKNRADALQRAVDLYTRWGRQDQAAAWRARGAPAP